MKISTQSRLAISAILDVAANGAFGPVSLAAIRERQHISLSYLEQLFRKLRQEGIVTSQRGPGGGYRLNRSLAGLSVADVIKAVDSGILAHTPCDGTDRCREPRTYMTDGLWRRVNDHLHDFLRTVTLAAILADAGKAAKPRQIWHVRAEMSFGGSGLRRQGKQPAAVVV